MTQKMAEHLCSTRFDISQEVFDAAWNVLNTHKQEEQMFMYLSMLDDKSFSSWFFWFRGADADFIDRRNRHKVKLKAIRCLRRQPRIVRCCLKCSDNNWRLAQRLKASFKRGKAITKTAIYWGTPGIWPLFVLFWNVIAFVKWIFWPQKWRFALKCKTKRKTKSDMDLGPDA